MRPLVLATIGVSSLAFLAIPLAGVARGEEPAFIVELDSPFVVGGTPLPPGSYHLSTQDGADPQVVLRSLDVGAGASAPVLTRLARQQDSTDPERATLVFDKLHDRLYLAEVWVPGRDGYLVRGTEEMHEHAVVGMSVEATRHIVGDAIVAQVDLPFEVGAKTLPPGVYSVSREGQGIPRLVIRSLDGRNTALPHVITRLAQVQGAVIRDRMSLVFDKLGDKLFLSEVWLPARDGYLVRATPGKHQHVIASARQ